MPLVVDCFGCDAPGGSRGNTICELTGLDFIWNGDYQELTYGMATGIVLDDGAGHSFTTDGHGPGLQHLTLEDWIDNLSGLKITASGGSTISQFHEAGSRASLTISWAVVGKYTCKRNDVVVSHFDVRSFNQNKDQTRCEEGLDTIDMECSLGPGGASIVLYSSGPLRECQFCSVVGQNFLPALSKYAPNTGASESLHTCLCVTGGEPPYSFYLLGRVPGGLSFDSGTGCITGTPHDSEINGNIIVLVVDSLGTEARVTCTLANLCKSVLDFIGNKMV